MYLWFANAHHKKIPLSHGIVKAKALLFAKVLGFDSFSASDEWLDSDLISSIDELRIRHPIQVLDDISPEDVLSMDQLTISSQPYTSEADFLTKIRGDETSVVIEDDDDDIEVVCE